MGESFYEMKQANAIYACLRYVISVTVFASSFIIGTKSAVISHVKFLLTKHPIEYQSNAAFVIIGGDFFCCLFDGIGGVAHGDA